MSTAVLIYVIVVAVLAVAVVGATVIVMLGHVRRLRARLEHVQRQLGPALEAVQRDTAITRAELARVGEAASRSGDGRVPASPSDRDHDAPR